MSIRQFIGQFINNHTETAESHYDERLRTRYYKTSKDKAMHAVESVLSSSGWKIKEAETGRGEVIAEPEKGGQSLLVATIVTVKPYRTAIDISCSSGTSLPSDFGKSKKIVVAIYEKLDKELPYLGTGMADEFV
ncbi:DUF1499 domain-containing protein [Alkalihalophilus marmarensis]|jgi:hypothetical protein|uniref:DUF1499 domain-containing protein n=1 Tax=Alkalihalophilus marmarensis DSM 21297 TaxID=1188261 RepID=U6SPE1_9BACI|nr:hypothetical protein [Alkalihalophilus marmarensis]ERN52506.1 hypothetical protein A33I_15915 [Alkalihalophilus marmarensis DSM 21297]MCM3487802.1 DUF1499 domain-containing protein [Alkalihalophilus marmarensis]